jgi:hypothetical protein
MNSLFNQVGMSQQIPQSNNNIVQMVKNSNNPGQLFQSMAQSNPQVQSIMRLIQQSNQTPKQLFYQAAQQQGVDPNQILGMFR